MLQSLNIKNFALIEDLSISFSKGFTIITGETGSGKSILLDALSLVLGKRADLSTLRNSEEKCVIEAEFLISDYNFQTFFENEEIDYEEITLVRREILPSGKSRAFINDSPVTLDILSKLGNFLVDIHSQNETQLIGSEDFQTYILDILAENQSRVENFRSELKIYKNHLKKLNELTEFQKNIQKEYDYKLFILNELQEANLKEGMQEELEQFYQQASNSEDIKERLSQTVSILMGEEMGVISLLSQARGAFAKLLEYGGKYGELSERIENAYIELDDVSQEIYDLLDEIDFDPKELALAQRKLQKIYDIQKKHQVNSVTELISIEKKLEKEVQTIENIDETIENQHKIVEQYFEKVEALASKIHEKRKEIIPKLTVDLENYLADLGMVNARFQIQVKKAEIFNSLGKDVVSFEFSANKGGNFGAIKKVASGGELSRIMLSIKSILASKVVLPTIIFDEIDTGVSGEISHKMGAIMQKMSETRQVFAITHLPQVAAKGLQHLKVFKEDFNGKTTTKLKLLSENERVTELAQMLGGAQITATATQHAIELLKNK